MTGPELLVDAFGRVQEEVRAVVRGLRPDDLDYRVDPGANSIAWLVWHLTRVQDDHIAHAAGTDQLWTSVGWADRFALPLAPEATGYGHRPEEAAVVRVASGDLLTGYHDAVHEATVRFVGGLSEADLARVVDTRWDPPVTLAVRLVSVIADDLEHAGQAAYVRGVLERA